MFNTKIHPKIFRISFTFNIYLIMQNKKKLHINCIKERIWGEGGERVFKMLMHDYGRGGGGWPWDDVSK